MSETLQKAVLDTFARMDLQDIISVYVTLSPKLIELRPELTGADWKHIGYLTWVATRPPKSTAHN